MLKTGYLFISNDNSFMVNDFNFSKKQLFYERLLSVWICGVGLIHNDKLP